MLFTLGVPLNRREVSLSPNWTSVELTPSADVSATTFSFDAGDKAIDGRVRMMPGSVTGDGSAGVEDAAFTPSLISTHVKRCWVLHIPDGSTL